MTALKPYKKKISSEGKENGINETEKSRLKRKGYIEKKAYPGTELDD